MITGEQIKAARTLLRLSRRQFAEMVHITPSLLNRIEGTCGPIETHAAVVAIVTALEAAGIEMIGPGAVSGSGGPGVRLKGDIVATDEILDIEADGASITADEMLATRRLSVSSQAASCASAPDADRKSVKPENQLGAEL